MESKINLIKHMIIIALLAESSIFDIKFKKIRLIPAITAGIVLILCELRALIPAGFPVLLNIAAGMSPGAVLYLVSKFSGGKIGEGDACLLAVIGIGAGPVKALLTVSTGLALAAVFSGFLMVLKKIRRDTAIPFVPFLLAGYLITISVMP